MERKPQDDADLEGISLVREPETPKSVEDALSPEAAEEIARLERRLHELASRRGTESATDEPVGDADADEIERVSRRINQLRHQQAEHADAVADSPSTELLG